MKLRDLTRPLYETVRLNEISAYTWIYTSDPRTDAEIEVPVYFIKNGADLANALQAFEGPELRGLVSDRMVVGADSWKVTHDDMFDEDDDEDGEDQPTENWKAMIYLYPDGVAIAPRTRMFTGIPVGQTAQYLMYHPILKRIYNVNQVPIIEPKGGIR